MKILFITRLFYPYIGGVEKHVAEVSKSLVKKGHEVTILTEKFDKNLKDKETVSGIKVVRFSYPHIKILGLKYIWWKILLQRELIKEADVVHIHDVFIWYLPFKFFYPHKKVFTTIHGLEWDNPLLKSSIWQKKLASKLSTGTVGVGKFLQKYLVIKFNLIIYGAASTVSNIESKKKNSIAYVGRLEKNTGLLKFLSWLKTNPQFKVDFCGDGELRRQCENYGNVYGFTDPAPFFKEAEFCAPGGYLAALEALSYKCKLKLFWNNRVKKDYWKMSPFVKKNVKVWAKAQTWNKLTNEYLNLYNHI